MGSTAVSGIWAKPTIDIQVSVRDVDVESDYRDAIGRAGWPLRLREPGHRLFRKWPPAPRRFHIHVCSVGSAWERDHLLFRDYLQSHPGVARDYEALKRNLLARHGIPRTEYTDGKTSFISAALREAERWASEVGWSILGPGTDYR